MEKFIEVSFYFIPKEKIINLLPQSPSRYHDIHIRDDGSIRCVYGIINLFFGYTTVLLEDYIITAAVITDRKNIGYIGQIGTKITATRTKFSLPAYLFDISRYRV